MSKRLTHEEFAQGLINAGFVNKDCKRMFYYNNDKVNRPVLLENDNTFYVINGFYACTERNLEIVIGLFKIEFEV